LRDLLPHLPNAATALVLGSLATDYLHDYSRSMRKGLWRQGSEALAGGIYTLLPTRVWLH